MKLKSIPRRLGFILGAQWTRDAAWTVFTILLARRSAADMGQIVLALTFGYLVKTAADVGLNDYLLSTFARKDARPMRLLGEVSWLKLAALLLSLIIAWLVILSQNYGASLGAVILLIAAGLGLDAISDSIFALCQARGRQDVELRTRAPAAIIGIGFGITAVLLDAPPVIIALYKPIESCVCMALCIIVLGRNPFGRLTLAGLYDLAAKMKSGLVFTGMAVCAMFYNKVNVIFLKNFGNDGDVGAYGVAWETIEGLSVLISSALLGKVIFPMLASLYKNNREAFATLAGQTARSLWAISLPVIFLICAESDRILTLIYGPAYADAATAQRLLTPCLVTAFLHNLAHYAMISMGRHKLLFGFYVSGVAVNLLCCFTLISWQPLNGAALALTITKVWVAILTISFFQWHTSALKASQWLLMVCLSAASIGIWQLFLPIAPREAAELAGLAPLLLLFWLWRPPSLFEKEADK